jgi:hypothetical protein
MAEFIGICAKLYHYVLENSSVSSRHKGVSNMGMKNTASNNIPLTTIGSVNLFKDPNFEEEQYDPMTLLYRECLFNEEQIHAKNIGFRTKDHIISFVEVEKMIWPHLMINVGFYWTECI